MTTFAPVARRDLGLVVVARVVVRRERRELARAGVDGLEDRAHAERVADLRGPPSSREAAQLRDLGVAEAVVLREAQHVARRASRRAAIASATSLMSTIWSRNHGSILVALEDLLERLRPARSACCTVDDAGRRSGDRRDERVEQLVAGQRRSPAPVERPSPSSRASAAPSAAPR